MALFNFKFSSISKCLILKWSSGIFFVFKGFGIAQKMHVTLHSMFLQMIHCSLHTPIVEPLVSLLFSFLKSWFADWPRTVIIVLKSVRDTNTTKRILVYKAGSRRDFYLCWSRMSFSSFMETAHWNHAQRHLADYLMQGKLQKHKLVYLSREKNWGFFQIQNIISPQPIKLSWWADLTLNDHEERAHSWIQSGNWSSSFSLNYEQKTLGIDSKW